MQVTKEASGLWVDFCLFWLCLPPPVRVMWPLLLNANKLSCMSFLTTTVQLLCLCLGVLQTSAQRKPYYSITSDFQTIPSSMEYFYQFCSSVNLKMDLLKMQQFLLWSWRRERMQLQTYPFSKVYYFFLLLLLYPDTVGRIILHTWTSLSKARSFSETASEGLALFLKALSF